MPHAWPYETFSFPVEHKDGAGEPHVPEGGWRPLEFPGVEGDCPQSPTQATQGYQELRNATRALPIPRWVTSDKPLHLSETQSLPCKTEVPCPLRHKLGLPCGMHPLQPAAGAGTHAGQRESQAGHIHALLHGHGHAVGQHQVGGDEVLQQAV